MHLPLRLILIQILFGSLIFSLTNLSAQSQYKIFGEFPSMESESVSLMGFNGMDVYRISESICDENGSFILTFSESDYGMGYLMGSDQKAFFVILEKEDIHIKGEYLALSQSVEISKGIQNQIFGQYASAHPRREQALSAWLYLEKMYEQDTLFSKHTKAQHFIAEEKLRIRLEDEDFLNSIDTSLYVNWFLPIRRLVSSVSVVAQYRTNEIPETIRAFRNLNYSDPRLYKSGLLKDAIESHFWLLENSGRSLDSVYFEMKISIDSLLKNLSSNSQLYNLISEYLFVLLERHSLFDASEYLALQVLSETRCTIDDQLARQMETYRTMKKGYIAPNIFFSGDVTKAGNKFSEFQFLNELESSYTLVVFGAGWCPQCREELDALANVYNQWKNYGVEVVLISLDTDKDSYDAFVKDFPFISFCDYKQWNTPAALEYHVFATPTMFLLDSSREIFLRPNSVKQIQAWIDWFLVQGN